MGFLSKLFGHGSETNGAKRKSGNAQKDTGAGPAIAAHSKDAKAGGNTGQNPKAANAKPAAKPANNAKAARTKAVGAKTATAKA